MDEEKRFEAFQIRPTQETLVDLLRACQDTVYTLCFAVLRHPQDAEDASQKVFMNLLDELPKLADIAHFRRWLHTVCLHVSIDLRRRLRTRQAHARRVSEQAEHAGAPSESEAFEIHEHLALLDGEARSLIVEHYFDRRPLESMAADRKCSAVTVWNRLQKALDRLKTSLRKAGAEGAAFGVGPLLDSACPLSAPRDLISAEIASKAAQVAAMPVGTAAVVMGGIAVKTKLLLAVALIGLLMLLSVPIVRSLRAGEGPRESSKPPIAAPKQAAPAIVKAAVVAPAVETIRAEPAVEKFATIGEFYKAFHKALFLLNDAERWRTLRRIGIAMPDDAFVRVQSRVRYKRGSHGYANLIQRQLLQEWARTGPGAAASFFRDLPGTLEDLIKREMLEAVLAEWTRADGPAALRFAEVLPEGVGRTWILNHLAAIDHPAQFSTTVLAMAPEERWAALENLAATWPAVDPAGALRWFQQIPLAQRDHFVRQAASRWAESDFAAALAWASASGSAEDLRAVLQGGAGSLPREAAEAAVKALDPRDPGTTQLLNGIAAAWAERDVAAALQFADSLGDRLNGEDSYLLIMRAAELDPSATFLWVTRRPEGEDRTKRLEALFRGWALSDRSTPQQGMSAIQTLPEQIRPRLMQKLVMGVAEFDPPSAAALAAGLPPEAVLHDDLGERWAYQDMAGAASWARRLPDVRSRDQAIAGILRLANSWDPLLAASLASEISETSQREQSFGELLEWQLRVSSGGGPITSILRAWTKVDPAAATRWVNGPSLSAELKAQALKALAEPARPR